MYYVEESLQNKCREVKELQLSRPWGSQMPVLNWAEGADALKGLAFTELPLQGACRSQIEPFNPGRIQRDVILASVWNARC